MKILYLPEVRLYFKELAWLLYEKEYFGFEESAIKYVEDLFNDIDKSLPSKHSKKASSYFDRYGKNMHYAVFKKNSHTQWYVFFQILDDNGETVYLVRYISNNHVISHLL